MNLRSLLQDILSEVSSKIISFQMELHLLITLVRSSDYFRFIESLRTSIMASQITSPRSETMKYNMPELWDPVMRRIREFAHQIRKIRSSRENGFPLRASEMRELSHHAKPHILPMYTKHGK